MWSMRGRWWASSEILCVFFYFVDEPRFSLKSATPVSSRFGSVRHAIQVLPAETFSDFYMIPTDHKQD